MSRHLSILTGFAAVPLMWVNVEAQPAAPEQPTAACRTIDIRDPRYFVNIIEREPGRPARTLYSATAARNAVCRPLDDIETDSLAKHSRTTAVVAERSVEISQKSRLEIDFDREWIESQMPTGFDANIRMSAKYTRGEKSQPLEIPSYYSTGVDSKPLMVHVNSLRPVTDLLLGLAKIRGALDTELARPELLALQQDIAADQSAQRTDEQQRAIERSRRVLESLRKVLDSIDVARSKLQEPGEPTSPPAVEGKSDSLIDSSPRQTISGVFGAEGNGAAQRAQAARLNARAASVRDSIAGVSRELGRIPNILPKTSVDTASKRARVEAAVILRAAPEIRAVIGSLYTIDADSGATVLSLFVNESPAVIRVVVSIIMNRLAELEKLQSDPQAKVEQIDEVIQSLRTQFTVLSRSRVTDEEGQKRLIKTRLANLRGTQILIPSTVLIDGDIIDLTIRNLDGPKDGDWDRVFTSRVTIRAFGLSTAFRDAALLVKRTGVNEQRNEQEVVDAFAAGATEKRSEQPVNYRATPGASISWGYQPRLGTRGATFLRWLQPTAGLHVSAPQFNSTVTRLVDGEMKVETVANEQHIGAGAIFGVFNNKVSLALGRVVTAREKKNYLAIGFSFVSLANGAVALASGQ